MSDETKVQGLSDDGRRVLASVLDEIIPARDDGKLAGAGELGLAAVIEETLRHLPDLNSMIQEALAERVVVPSTTTSMRPIACRSARVSSERCRVHVEACASK